MVSHWEAPYHESGYDSQGQKVQVLKYYEFEVDDPDLYRHKKEADRRARAACVGTPRWVA